MNNMIAERITELRKKKNMTQEDVARAIGVTNQAVSKWEAGINYPDVELIPRIASLFGVSVNYLFAGEEETSGVPADVMPELADDGNVRVFVFKGKRLLGKESPARDEWVNVNFEGDSIEVYGNVNTDDLTLRGGLTCHACLNCRGVLIIEEGNMNGPVACEGDLLVKNGNVNGSVDCGGAAYITGDVGGYVKSGGDADICGNVNGHVDCRGDVNIAGDVGERVSAEGDAFIGGSVGQNVSVGGDLGIGGNVGGNVACGGDLSVNGVVGGGLSAEVDPTIGGRENDK